MNKLRALKGSHHEMKQAEEKTGLGVYECSARGIERFKW